MCLQSYLRSICDQLPPGASFPLNSAGLAWAIERHGSCHCAGCRPQSNAEVQSRDTLTIAEVAVLVDEPVSSVRGAIAKGACGDPSTLKGPGKAYRVPRAAALHLRDELAAGRRLSDYRLSPPPVQMGPAKGGERAEAPSRQGSVASMAAAVEAVTVGSPPELEPTAMNRTSAPSRGQSVKSAKKVPSRSGSRPAPSDIGAWRKVLAKQA